MTGATARIGNGPAGRPADHRATTGTTADTVANAPADAGGMALRAHHGRADGPPSLDDLRFRALLGASAWASLPAAVRRRFGHRLSGARTATYAGRVVECRASVAGRLLAALLRPIGGPLPTSTDTGVAAAVVVTEDEAGAGQFWTRIYGRHDGFPKVIRSSKRFRGLTGLEEHVGGGLGMALTVAAVDGSLRFDSAGYFVRLGSRRLRLPRWATPGALRVEHVDRGADEFDFTMRLVHPWLGELIWQRARFADRDPT